MLEPHALFRALVALLPMLILGEAGLSKLFAREVPGWFKDQFDGTWLGTLPLGPQWWFIALAEVGAAGLCLASLASGEFLATDAPPTFLHFGLLAASAVFTMLSFGLRVAGDFAGSANGFYYAALSLLLFAVV